VYYVYVCVSERMCESKIKYVLYQESGVDGWVDGFGCVREREQERERTPAHAHTHTHTHIHKRTLSHTLSLACKHTHTHTHGRSWCGVRVSRIVCMCECV